MRTSSAGEPAVKSYGWGRGWNVGAPFIKRRRGFTLIEIMIVVGMIAIVMAFGIPSFVDATKRKPMRQGVQCLLDACHAARAQAIESGTTKELVISGDNHVSGGNYNGQIDLDIVFEMIDVNFQDMKEQKEARVHFFPNGTSDEFTVLIRSSQQEFRKISLDVATGLPQLEIVR